MKTITRDRLATLRYRHHYADADRRQVRIVIAATTITVLLTIRNDLALVTQSTLYLLLAGRLAHALMTAWMYVYLVKQHSLRTIERVASTWNVISVVMVIGIGLSRKGTGEIQGPFLGAIALICIFYFAQRGFLLSRMLCCFVVSGGVIERLATTNAIVSMTTRTTGVILLLLLNILGIATARTFEAQRRARYEAERQEKRIRLELIGKNLALAEQKARAEALYRSRTAFLAAMSHEFRTPMNAVIGLSGILVDAPIESEYRNHARTIQDSARALLVLLNDVLDFAKIDAGKLDLTFAAVDVRAFLRSVVDMMQPAARAKNLVLETRFADHLPDYLLSDDARLRQVLVNLLSNAVKFTDTGTITFSVSCHAIEENRYELGFAVRDTGIGMSPEVVSRLFQPFEQGDAGVSRRFGGTGLGLVISQRIVQALEGEIIAESRLGEGSTFSFNIRASSAEKPIATSLWPQPKGDLDRSKTKVLVVDDLAINRQVAKLMLTRLGYSTDLAKDGPSAVEAVANKDYDIVFMDLQMPEMSGIEATKTILDRIAASDSAHTNRKAPTFIAMSASVFEEDQAACRAAGMRDFVAKPVDVDRLAAVIEKWLSRRQIDGPST